MSQPMIFGVWQVNGVNQVQTVGGNASNSPAPKKPRQRIVTDCDGCGNVSVVDVETKLCVGCSRQ